MQAQFHASNRMNAIGVSSILKIMQIAAELRRQGRDVIDLSAGEPDFDTPDAIKRAANEAISRGETKYTVLDGLPELKAAIREKFRRDYTIEYADHEIIVSAGAKQVLFNALMASVGEGDEVIIPAPYWTSYRDMVAITGATPVIVPCPENERFLLTAPRLEAAVTERTRWLLLNSPSNPTGAMYSREEYGSLLEILRKHPDIWLIADDIYEHIVYDDAEFVSPLVVAPELRDRTLVINGVSKAYAMTGWRVGYGCGPPALVKAMVAVQSQATSCPCSVSQWAAIEALTGPQDVVRERCKLFEARRDRVVELLSEIDGIHCDRPPGAFYVYVNCEGLIGAHAGDGQVIESDTDVAAYLLQSANVAVVPGTAFGLSPFFRLSFASSLETIETACERIATACAALESDREAV